MMATANWPLAILIYSLAYVLVMTPASWLIRLLLRPWIDQLRQSQASTSLVRAGALSLLLIGLLSSIAT